MLSIITSHYIITMHLMNIAMTVIHLFQKMWHHRSALSFSFSDVTLKSTAYKIFHAWNCHSTASTTPAILYYELKLTNWDECISTCDSIFSFCSYFQNEPWLHSAMTLKQNDDPRCQKYVYIVVSNKYIQIRMVV